MTTAENYLQASLEHIAAAFDLHEKNEDGHGHYVLSHYVAGLAVECTLRAYRYRVDLVFDSRHDLDDLRRISGFDRVIPKGRVEVYDAHFNQVSARWSNNHRFLSEAGLRSVLKGSRLDRGIGGDFLKESSRRIVAAAHEIVLLGERRWTR